MSHITLDQEIDEPIFYFRRPSLSIRIKSTLIDGVIILILMCLAAGILNGLEIESGTVRGIALGLVFLYEPLLISFGQTIGQRMTGLRVIRKTPYADNDRMRRIIFPASLLRSITKILLGWISLLIIHHNQYGRAIHDQLSGSLMVFAKH